MYQDLVVSPLFLNSFSSLENDKAYSIMSYLATEIFLCDGNNQLLKEYDKIKEEHKHDPHSLLFIENFIRTLTIGKVKSVQNISAKDRSIEEWDFYGIEKMIASFSNWKIILTNNSNNEICDKLEKEMGVELSDTDNYLCPSEGSKIRSIQRITKLPGDEFDFRNWIKKYLSDTKNLIIHDGYACVNYAFQDVQYIIKKLPRNTTVKVITLSDKARNYFSGDDGIVVEERLRRLKNKVHNKSIKWVFKGGKKLLSDRHIETDKFIIDLGHALGATYKDEDSGKILCKKQFTITVSKIN